MPFSLYRSRRRRQRRRRVLLLVVLATLSALALYLFLVGGPVPANDAAATPPSNDATERADEQDPDAGSIESSTTVSPTRSRGELRLTARQTTATARSDSARSSDVGVASSSGDSESSDSSDSSESLGESNDAGDSSELIDAMDPVALETVGDTSASSPVPDATGTLSAESMRATEIMSRPTQTRTPAPRSGRRDILARARGAPFVPPAPLFSMKRPFLGENLENRGSAFYPYGTDGGGEYLLHHGIDISNPLGTPVRAIQDGEVVFAGEDREGQAWGKADEKLRSGFYGRLVVVRHSVELDGEPIFSLYGHLSETRVRRRQFVRAGEILGMVGAEGVALGPHLHLEIRWNARDYGKTLNPELFVEHLPKRGAIVGRVSDAAGEPIQSVEVGLYRVESRDDRRWIRQTTSYPSEAVNGLASLGENFVFADLEAGVYEVLAEAPGGKLSRVVTVLEGRPSGIVLRR